jgi:hypothetical protein
MEEVLDTARETCFVWVELKYGGVLLDDLEVNTVAPSKRKNKVQCGFILDVVIQKGAEVVKLLPGIDEALLAG